jgi:peroxiredoxin
MSKVKIGASLGARELRSVTGSPVAIPDSERLIHLQFRRFAGCPVCNLHLQSIVRRHEAIEKAGVREVVVFHSPADELLRHTADLPFAVIADPEKELYAEFGVESAPRALADPRVWGTIARSVVRSSWAVLRDRDRPPALRPHGGRTGLPADFLISPVGVVVAAKYGDHAYDQWSVEELLELVDIARRSSPTGSV